MEGSSGRSGRVTSLHVQDQQNYRNSTKHTAPFRAVHEAHLAEWLEAVQPAGGNAFWDALLEGSRHIFSLYRSKEAVYDDYGWSFLHIIVATGEDNASTIEELELLGELSALMFGRLKLVIVAIEVPEKMNLELESIRLKVNQWNAHIEVHQVKRKGLTSALKDITKSIHHQRAQPSVRFSTKNFVSEYFEGSETVNEQQLRRYAFLISLPTGAAMAKHSRWESMTREINRFVQRLRSDDLLSVMTYNKDTRLLGDPQKRETTAILMDKTNMSNNSTPSQTSIMQKSGQLKQSQELNSTQSSVLVPARRYTIESQGEEKRQRCPSGQQCAECSIY